MTREDLARKIIEVIDAYGDKKLDMIATIEEICKQAIDEPVSEDLEKAAEEYAKAKHTNLALIDIVSLDFKAGANWQKQKDVELYGQSCIG